MVESSFFFDHHLRTHHPQRQAYDYVNGNFSFLAPIQSSRIAIRFDTMAVEIFKTETSAACRSSAIF